VLRHLLRGLHAPGDPVNVKKDSGSRFQVAG
jgi:hypothetical protein